MFVTLVLICGMDQGPMGCQPFVGQIASLTLEDCGRDIDAALLFFDENLKPGHFVSDAQCVPVSVSG